MRERCRVCFGRPAITRTLCDLCWKSYRTLRDNYTGEFLTTELIEWAARRARAAERRRLRG